MLKKHLSLLVALALVLTSITPIAAEAAPKKKAKAKKYTVQFIDKVRKDAKAPKKDYKSGGYIIKSKSIEKGKTIGAFPAPKSHTGYTFTKWTPDKLTKDTKVTKNLTITANYRAHKYKIKYDNGGGSGKMPDSELTYGKAANLRANSFTRQFHTFTGWMDKDTGKKYKNSQSVKNLTSKDNGTVTLIAQWSEQAALAHKATLNLGGGTSEQGTVIYFDRNSDKIALEAPTKAGWKFVGWTGTDLSTTKKNVYIPSGTDKDLSFTAVWSPLSWKITFNANGGKGSVGAIAASSDLAVTLPTSGFTKEREMLIGWEDKAAGIIYSLGQSVTNLTSASGGSIKLYAVWAVNSDANIEITIDGAGGKLDGSKSKTTLYTGNGKTVDLEPLQPRRVGYEFAGWSCIAGTISANTYTAGTNDDIITANWNKIYSIKIAGNGGSLKTGVSSTTVKVVAGDSIDLTSYTPTKDGYVFAGWECGKGQLNGDIYIATESADTVKAVWDKLAEQKNENKKSERSSSRSSSEKSKSEKKETSSSDKSKSEKEKTTTKAKAPRATRITKIVCTKKKAVVHFKTAANAAGYQVEVKDSKGKKVKTVKVAGKSKRKCTVTGLKSGKTYKFRVRSYNKNGSKTQYSKWSAQKGAKTKK